VKLNFSVNDSKAVGWLSFGRYGLGSFTFPLTILMMIIWQFFLSNCVYVRCVGARGGADDEGGGDGDGSVGGSGDGSGGGDGDGDGDSDGQCCTANHVEPPSPEPESKFPPLPNQWAVRQSGRSGGIYTTYRVNHKNFV